MVKPSLIESELKEAIGWVTGLIAGVYALVTVAFGVLYRMRQGVLAADNIGGAYETLNDDDGNNAAAPSAPVVPPHSAFEGSSADALGVHDAGGQEVVPYGDRDVDDDGTPIIPPKNSARMAPPPSGTVQSLRVQPNELPVIIGGVAAVATTDAGVPTSFVPQILAVGVFYAIPVYQVKDGSISQNAKWSRSFCSCR